jgi:hypothetical protein
MYLNKSEEAEKLRLSESPDQRKSSVLANWSDLSLSRDSLTTRSASYECINWSSDERKKNLIDQKLLRKTWRLVCFHHSFEGHIRYSLNRRLLETSTSAASSRSHSTCQPFYVSASFQLCCRAEDVAIDINKQSNVDIISQTPSRKIKFETFAVRGLWHWRPRLWLYWDQAFAWRSTCYSHKHVALPSAHGQLQLQSVITRKSFGAEAVEEDKNEDELETEREYEVEDEDLR